MKKAHLASVLFLCLLITGCSGNKKEITSGSDKKQEITKVKDTTPQVTWFEGETPLVFNEKENYPETNIRLSELATPVYVPLGINDSTVLRLRGTCKGNEYLMTNDYIYLQEEQSAIYIFSKNGKPLKKINRQGGGPEEYRYISSYAVDTLRKEIYVQDSHNKRTMVYDLTGKFKRTFPNLAKEISILNDSLLINFFQYNPKGPRYSVIRKKDGSMVKSLPIRFNVKLPHDSWGRLAYGSLLKSPKGIFLSNLGNDTIFEIRKNMQILPRIIDKSDYGTNFAQAHPTIETNRYLMFYILRCHSYKPHVKQRFYIYDKKEKQIYKMTDYPDNSYWTLMDDYPHIQNWETTQTSNIGIRSRMAYALLEAEGKHGDKQLKAIIDTLDIEANPVLQIMIFHDVEETMR